MKRSTIRNKLDKKVSEIVRSRGSCERCGKKTNLQAAHIFSRRYLGLRWQLDNVLCLCAGCHFWAHSNPIMFTEFVKSHITEFQYNLLKEVYKQVTKYTQQDLELKLKVLNDYNTTKPQRT